jgi:uncharacterized protein YuzE
MLSVNLPITYDVEADALYIKFSDKKATKTVALNNFMILDLDDKQRVIGLEIICFSKLGSKGIEVISIDI